MDLNGDVDDLKAEAWHMFDVLFPLLLFVRPTSTVASVIYGGRRVDSHVLLEAWVLEVLLDKEVQQCSSDFFEIQGGMLCQTSPAIFCGTNDACSGRGRQMSI